MKISKSFYQSTPWLFATISLPCQATNTGIGQCIGDIYNWSIAIVGIAAFIQVVRAGIEYFTAAGNASDAKDAKSKISDAILGIILLFSSYVILRTINPDLVGGGPGSAIFDPGSASSATRQVSLTAIFPMRVVEGGLLTLSGVNFTSTSEVTIDGNPYDPGQVMINGSSEIIVQLDNTFSVGEAIDVAVRNGSQTTVAKTVVIVGKNQITATSLTPAQGPPGTVVTLTGTNLTSEVKLAWDGTVVSSTLENNTRITFKVPTSAREAIHNVTANLNDTTTGPLPFSVVSDANADPNLAPHVDSVDVPDRIAFGNTETIEISGSNLKAGAQLVMGEYGTYETASVGSDKLTFVVDGSDNIWEANGDPLPTAPVTVSVYFYQDGKLVYILSDIEIDFPNTP